MHLMGRGAAQVTLFNAVSVPATSAITHEGLDTSSYSGKTVMVQSTASVTVYIQVSYDNDNWFELVDESDTNRTWNCNNEKIYFGVDDYCRYFRVVIHNAGASAATVTCVVSLVV